jgi:peptidyl-prolyl cis-trans isomerase A (cyclophilin A)
MTTIKIETIYGDIDAELYDEVAPITVANFLAYVKAGAYQGGSVWRTVTTDPDNQPHNDIKIDVIQATCREDFPKYAAIVMEGTEQTGLRHEDGTISMARFAPDSAQADFFICIGEQPSLNCGGLRNPDGVGFAAFGRVTAGMDVVRRIQQQPQHEQRLNPSIALTAITVRADQ